jgi:TonB family protein
MPLRHMKSLVCLLFLVPTLALAQRYPTSAATDAKGVSYLGTQYPGRNPPWLDDVIHTVEPNYPELDRAVRHHGTGMFRLILDLKTGAVTKVTIIRTTGYGRLDDCAITALRQWRWKPGRWKEIGLPVTFNLTPSAPDRTYSGARVQ